MLRSLSREVAVGLKDQFREVRHLIRTRRHDRIAASDATPEIERVMSHAASILDDTLTLAETVSQTVLPIVRERSTKLNGYDAWFCGEPGERAFRHDLYAAFATLMSGTDPNPRPVHESRLSRTHQAVLRSHAPLVAALAKAAPGERLDAVAGVAAATFVELIKARAFIPDQGTDRPNLRPLATVVIAGGLATLNDWDLSDRDLIESASIAADARHERVLRALDSADPVTQLSRVFATLLAALP